MTQEEKKTKKKHGCLTSILVFFVILAIIIAAPIIYFKSNIPDPVTYTNEDVDNFYKKIAVEPGDYAFTMEDFLSGNIIAEGSTDVEITLTSAEFTGGLQHSAQFTNGLDIKYLTMQNDIMLATLDLPYPLAQTEIKNVEGYSGKGFLTNINIRFTGIDTFEILATPTVRFKEIYSFIPELSNFAFALDRVVGSTLYFRGTMTYSTDSGIAVATKSAFLNGAPIPVSIIAPYETNLSRGLTDAINRTEGLDIKAMKISENGFYFKGTVPKSIKSIQ